MKTSIALLAVGASFAMAQQLSDLPPCGQTCIQNMLGLGPSLGCKAGDTVCYCSEPNFGYGVRDCSNEACPASDAATVIAYGEAFCKALLASASVSGGSALTILSSAASAASGSAASAASASATVTGSGAAGSVTAITTVPLVATISGSPVTTGFSTVFSSLGAAASSGASSALSSALSDASSAASAASSGASSFASSAASAASSAASSAESALSSLTASLASGASSAASAATATSTGGAPMMTAGPILGAAGMAALLFI